jgi:signal transduction histidine kinase
MHRSSVPSAAAAATSPPPAAPSQLAADGAAASAELIQRRTEDRERIAQRINDVVVRRIFAAGLDLQAALGLIGDQRGAGKIWHAIGELDQAVADIRDIIFDGNRDTHGPGATSTHEGSVPRV